MRWIPLIAVILALVMVKPASAQGATAHYGARVPSRLPGCYSPVANNMIGSNEHDHASRGSPTLAYDWSAAVGSPVFSICPGVVRYTTNNNAGGYGWHIVIDHGNGLSTLYAHCLENSFMVEKGQQVTAWTPICRVGLTGMTSWPHVHLNIDVDGQHTEVGRYWDQSLLDYCKFCQSNNDPKAPISGVAVTPTQTVRQASTTRLQAMLSVVSQAPPETVGQIIMVLLVLMLFGFWLSPNWLRTGIVAGVVATSCGLTATWLMQPVSGQPAQAALPAGDWQAAYRIVIGSEGAKCTEDGAHTAGGITQGTYDAWRMSHGLGPADVCRNLTEQQRQQIFYERYWMRDDVRGLPFALRLTAVDHIFNTGSASRGLAICGTDVHCFNNWRVQDYRSKSNFGLYGAGWLNRVQFIRSKTEGGTQ